MYVSGAGVAFGVYVKDNKVVSVAPRGGGDAAFKDFPAPWNRDTFTDRLEIFAEWNRKGYISPDSLTISDANTPFWAGMAASVIGTLDDVENMARNIPQYSPEAVIGEFLYVDDVRNLVPGAMSVSLASNNGLAVPDNSKKKDDVMRFLDWLFGSQENHDLFELGITDKDYTLNSDGTYKPLTTYPANWPGYGFTWNPNYVTYSEYFAGDIRKYRDYERAETSITQPLLTGFSFDGTDVNIASYIAQVRAVYGKIERTQLHGILSDGTRAFSSAKEMLNTIIAECYRAGLQPIQDELARQIQAYLDGRKK
jgi:putative aldouronate transport system substrate-binding protein